MPRMAGKRLGEAQTEEAFLAPATQELLRARSKIFQICLPIFQRQDRKDSMARISGGTDVSRGLGSSQKCTSDCAITDRGVCVPVPEKEERWLRRSVGGMAALRGTAVLGRLEQRREGQIRDGARACEHGAWKTEIGRTL